MSSPNLTFLTFALKFAPRRNSQNSKESQFNHFATVLSNPTASASSTPSYFPATKRAYFLIPPPPPFLSINHNADQRLRGGRSATSAFLPPQVSRRRKISSPVAHSLHPNSSETKKHTRILCRKHRNRERVLQINTRIRSAKKRKEPTRVFFVLSKH